ncbi:MAG: hypothetical protein Q7S32_03430 [bacterium]|nr:hypothetical protein [bacterium]
MYPNKFKILGAGVIVAPLLVLILGSHADFALTAPASGFPGGFVEKSNSIQTRPILKTTAQLSFVPSGRGGFTFPAPYNTRGSRITIPADGTVYPVGYSYWRVMNNHVGSNTMYIAIGTTSGPILFSYDKTTEAVQSLGAMTFAGNTEGMYFSATQPNRLYSFTGTRLLAYDVVSRTTQTVFDIASNTALYGSNRYLWQVHSSNNDDVHSATVRDGATYNMLGCMAYKVSTNQWFWYPRIGDFDECQIDKGGRWLVIKENVDALYDVDNRFIDLTTGIEKRILDQNGAVGHSDNGFNYTIGADNWDNDSFSTKVWQFATNPLTGLEVYKAANWSAGGPQHISHTNATSADSNIQYACGSGADSGSDPHGNELLCFKLDGSLDTLIIAPIMTNLAAAGGGDSYGKQPKANLDVTGQYALWTANLDSGRLDVILAKIPSQVLMGFGPTPTPTLTLTPVLGVTPTPTPVPSTPPTPVPTPIPNVNLPPVQPKLDNIPSSTDYIPPSTDNRSTKVVRRPPARLTDFNLKEGDVVSAVGSADPDIYIVNEHGYRRLFLNPVIFSFYGHLGGFHAVKSISPNIRDAFPATQFFRNCETNDPKIYALEVTGEDTGILHHINMTGDQAAAEDADFFSQVFCINTREFSWYALGDAYSALSQVPTYERTQAISQPSQSTP